MTAPEGLISVVSVGMPGPDGPIGPEGPVGPQGPAGTPGSVDITGLDTGAMSPGLFGYVSSNDTISPTDNAVRATARSVGAYVGTAGSIRVFGVVAAAQITTASGLPAPGDLLYVAAASDDVGTGAGKLTKIPPNVGFLVQVGVCLNNSNYIASKTVAVLLDAVEPVDL